MRARRRQDRAMPDDQFRPPETTVTLPWDRLAAHVEGAGLTFARDVAPRQFAAGMGNLNYLIQIDGKPAVLRRPPLGPIPPGANDMKREHRTLSRLWQKFALAPRSFLYCEDADVIGAHFLIMEYRDGQAIAGKTLPGALAGDAGAARRLTEMLVRILADLHAVEPAAIGLSEFGRPDGFLTRAVEGWSKRGLIATDDDPPRALPALRDWLRANAVPDGAPTLLHNDFKLDNVLLDDATMRTPVAVLDWDQSTRGDPLFDLATLLSYWTEAGDPDCMHDLAQMPTAAPGALSRSEAIALYARLTGRDMSDFTFHRVLAMYKLAVVFLQLYAQYRRGTVTDPRYEPFERIGNGILDFAHDVATGE
jgi:aminoglycoside phosphotransferase (APT) family kinase protein